MSKMYLLEPRVSEEDRLWAEEHYEVKRLKEQIEKSKKKLLIGGIVILLCGIVILILGAIFYKNETSYTYIESFTDISEPGSYTSTPPETALMLFIFFIFFALCFMVLSAYMFIVAKKGSKYLITQKNVCIETLVEERNLNQENILSEGEKNE